MGCKSSKIAPKRHTMGLFEVLGRVESMYYNHKYSSNSYDDMELIELKDYCIKARHLLKDSFMPEEARKWILSRISLYETITILNIKHTGVRFVDDLNEETSSMTYTTPPESMITNTIKTITNDITPPPRITLL